MKITDYVNIYMNCEETRRKRERERKKQTIVSLMTKDEGAGRDKIRYEMREKCDAYTSDGFPISKRERSRECEGRNEILEINNISY